MRVLNNWRVIVLLCIAPGLLPFVPEPHLFGKLRWVAGGAVGMGPADWFDLALHGVPWILAIRLLVVTFTRKRIKRSQ